MSRRKNIVVSKSATIAAAAQKFSFAQCALSSENVAHNKAYKSLKAEWNSVVENRRVNVENKTMTREQAEKAFPLESVVLRMNAERERHERESAPLKALLKESYAIIPEDLYVGYCIKVNSFDRAPFVASVKVFLIEGGFNVTSDAAVQTFADRLSERLGARMASDKAIVRGDDFTAVMKCSQFNRLFMGALIDIINMQSVSR